MVCQCSVKLSRIRGLLTLTDEGTHVLMVQRFGNTEN